MLEKIEKLLLKIQSGSRPELSSLLESVDSDDTLEDQVHWLQRLIVWLRSPGAEGPQVSTRVKFLLQLLERHPEWKLQSALVIRWVLREARATRLYAEVGLPSRPTFSGELKARLGSVFLPHFDDPHKMSALLAYLFFDRRDRQALASISVEQASEVVKWLMTGTAPGESLIPNWQEQVFEACQILLSRALSISLREDVADRAPEFAFAGHPFLEAQSHFLRLQERWKLGSVQPADFDELASYLFQAQGLITAVKLHLETRGVSVDLVYQLERLKKDLIRMHRLLALLKTSKFRPEETLEEVLSFLGEILKGLQDDRQTSVILRKHFGLLARKVVERTGETGEHYVVQSSREWYLMLAAGAGGGLITAFTAFIKYAVDTHGWPLFLEFCYISLNYSASFLIMHMLGFKLATKQPSVTASHLAARLKQDQETDDDQPLIEEVARIARSQFAALLGNVALVIPMALVLGLIVRVVTGSDFLSPAKAEHVLESLNPLASAALFYAALTGFLLWLSSVSAGWAENASTFHRIPQMLGAHPLARYFLGPHRARKVGELYARNVTGVVSAVSFGVLLGLVPLIGKFFGLPLDIRHVTLSSGIAAAAFQSVPWDLTAFALVWIGVLLIGLLNFGVSFYISLMLAVRARDVPRARVHRIFGGVGRHFLKRPGSFFLPQAEPTNRVPVPH